MLNKINSQVEPKVFWWANLMIYFLVFSSVFFGEKLASFFENLKTQFISSFGWSYIIFSISLVITLLYIVFKFGSVKIGEKNSEPDFSRLSWLSMLFSAGLGTGLIYAGTFEPLAHFYGAPQLSGFSENQKFIEAMDITFYHWGFPAWMMYSSAGLMFAVLSFNLNKKFQFSHFVPDRFPRVKVLVNVAAILSILIGVITTFVLASSQMTSGLVRILPTQVGELVTPASAIALVTVVATFSVLSGLKRGIRILSEVNILIAFSLFLFIFFNIDLYFFSSVFVKTLGLHITSLPAHLFYRSFINDDVWLSNWTLLYWAWWTAWLPFVGLFIARISKGRTIREYVFGTVVVPSLVTFLWFGLFGTAGYLRNLEYSLGLENMVGTDSSEILFTVLETMPFSEICTALAVLCVFIFYVTSSDSGSYVVDMISSGKAENHNSYLKVYWSVLEGALAIVLLKFGGVSAIKSLVILISLPVLIYISYGMFRLIPILEKIRKEQELDYKPNDK
jgi:choline/carnitine/betaine transport